MSFYPDIKPGLSPSGISQWLQSRAQFARTYFQGERAPETSAMRAGTMVHRLIEAGAIKPQHLYPVLEEELSFEIIDGILFRGRPDSFEKKAKAGTVRFVDYKTGRASEWEKKLPTDIKMRATAWLVWMNAGKPEKVLGSIEFFQMTWDPDAKEVVPIEDKPSEIYEIAYAASEMELFTEVILKAIKDVNAFYEKWQASEGADFVNEADLQHYLTLRAKRDALDAEIDEVADRLKTQMEFGGRSLHKTPYGSLYLIEKRAYDYPPELRINYRDMGLVLEDAQEIAKAVKVAQQNYSLLAEPRETSVSLGFRAAKA